MVIMLSLSKLHGAIPTVRTKEKTTALATGPCAPGKRHGRTTTLSPDTSTALVGWGPAHPWRPRAGQI